jgi:MFS family permease
LKKSVILPTDTQFPSKHLTILVFLISSTLAWFFLLQTYFHTIFVHIIAEIVWIKFGLIIFWTFGAFSAILGSVISERIKRRRMIVAWLTLATGITAALAMFQGLFFLFLSTMLLGFSLGFGFPSSVATFADFTKIEQRARIAGIIILVAFALTFLGMIIISITGSNLLVIIIYLVFLRATGFISLAVNFSSKKRGQEKSLSSIATNPKFAAYLVPWVLFNVAAGMLAWGNISTIPGYASAHSLAFPIAAISGLVAGILADRFGRRQPIMISLISFGFSFAILSFIVISLSLYIYYVTYGIAWGFLLAIYLTIPGDLSSTGSREKFYALGTVTPLIVYISLSALPDLFNFEVAIDAIAPILSIVLFLSVIPILRAEETLTESKQRKRRMKEYLERLGKVIEEETN